MGRARQAAGEPVVEPGLGDVVGGDQAVADFQRLYGVGHLAPGLGGLAHGLLDTALAQLHHRNESLDLGAAHLVASALARREAVAIARDADQRLRDQEAVALDLAREDLAAAIRALARAQGRFDAMSGRLDHARALVAADREAREQLELEDAGAFRSFR